MTPNSFNWQSVILKWLPTGVGGVISAHWAIVGGKVKEAAIALGVTIVYPLLVSLFEGFMKGAKKRADEKGQAFGEAFVDFVVLDLPKKIRWKLSRFEKQYRQSVIDYYRDLKVEGFKIGLPVLDLQDVFVPLKLVAEIPQKVERDIIPNRTNSAKPEEKIWSFLPQSYRVSSYRNLAILAPPGYGKTTLLQYLTLVYAKRLHRRSEVVYLIPVLLFLRDLRGELMEKNPPHLAELIVKAVEKQPAFARLKPPPKWFEKRLREGKCLVMLDGLDEVAKEEERVKVSKWINEQMLQYQSAIFILTSRPYGYDSNLFEKVDNVLEVKPFDLKGVKRFIRKWYEQTEIKMRAGRDDPAVIATAKENAEDLIERIANSPSLRTLANNPLLVTMIATVHYTGDALPRRRVELYAKICDVLLGGRLAAKRLQTNLTVEQRKSVLQVLALKLMEKKTRTFSLGEGVELIEHQLAAVDSSLKPELFLEEVQNVCGLLVEKQIGFYEFAHLSFQEYLASCQIKKTQQEDILRDNFDNSWWGETIRLYVSQGNGSNLIDKGLENGKVYSLSLAHDCSEEGLETDPEVKNKLETILEKGLESNNISRFRIAAAVKLSRRLKNLLEINENLSIDRNFITGAEYLFFKDDDEGFYSTKSLINRDRRPITRISYRDALKFCWWLSCWGNPLNQENKEQYYYRLPTAKEIKNYPSLETEIESFQFGNVSDENLLNKGIRVVRSKVSSIFEYETVTVSGRGKIIGRKTYCAQYIKEDLGNDIELEMVDIPGGTFVMGSLKEGNNSEKPLHQVTVQPFFMGKYSITQAQYQQVMSENILDFKGDERPVEEVSWDDAVEFCRKLSQQTGKEYRLPTEAEWEYACRAGTTTPFHFGVTISTELANYNGNYTYGEGVKGEYREKTTPVGYFKVANNFGLYDMHGNVWEWCEDDWHENYENASDDGSAWLLRNRNRKVVRGGSWNIKPNYCRSACRDFDSRGYRYSNIGFRVVCVAPRTT